MAIDDVVKGQKNLEKQEGLRAKLHNDGGDSSLISEMYNLNELSPAEQRVLYDQNPLQLDNELRGRIGAAQGNLVQKVIENYAEAMDTFDPEKLYSALTSLRAKETGNAAHNEIVKMHKKINAIEDEIRQGGDYSKYLKDLEGRDKYAATVISAKAQLNPQIYRILAASRVKMLETQMLEKFFLKDKDSQPKLDTERMKSYIRQTIGAQDDNGQFGSYLAIGQEYKEAA